MGVRIKMYAVDSLAFEREILPMSLAECLQVFAKDSLGPEDEMGLYFLFADQGLNYISSPSRGIRVNKAKESRALQLKQLSSETLLRQSLREYLAGGSTIYLSQVLQALSYCPSIPCAHSITSGHRRWWIGSFLEGAASYWGLHSETYSRLQMVFGEVLQGWKCGTDILAADLIRNKHIFSGLYEDDADTKIGVWNEDEISFVTSLLRELLSAEMLFQCPSRSEPDETVWNEWVTGLLHEFLRLETVPFRPRTAVSFIG